MRDLNPYRDTNPAKEFWYDLRHPRAFWETCFKTTLRGENPRVDSMTRFAGIGCMVVGAGCFVVGLLAVVWR